MSCLLVQFGFSFFFVHIVYPDLSDSDISLYRAAPTPGGRGYKTARNVPLLSTSNGSLAKLEAFSALSAEELPDLQALGKTEHDILSLQFHLIIVY